MHRNKEGFKQSIINIYPPMWPRFDAVPWKACTMLSKAKLEAKRTKSTLIKHSPHANA